jgi:hypothetical protein
MASPSILLLILHSVVGTEIDINAGEITSMYETREDDNNDKLVTKGTRCIINLTDGKFASVTESCRHVRDQIAVRFQDRLNQIMKE